MWSTVDLFCLDLFLFELFVYSIVWQKSMKNVKPFGFINVLLFFKIYR